MSKMFNTAARAPRGGWPQSHAGGLGQDLSQPGWCRRSSRAVSTWCGGRHSALGSPAWVHLGRPAGCQAGSHAHVPRDQAIVGGPWAGAGCLGDPVQACPTPSVTHGDPFGESRSPARHSLPAEGVKTRSGGPGGRRAHRTAPSPPPAPAPQPRPRVRDRWSLRHRPRPLIHLRNCCYEMSISVSPSEPAVPNLAAPGTGAPMRI